ncbi:MAG TPA: ACT domain-containing protein, partial [Gemmataceae bacterium]
IVVSGVELNPDHGRVTIHGLPDRPGNCSRVFEAIAAAGILVDMIIQNSTEPGTAELSFSVPKADLARALERTREVTAAIDPGARVVADADSVVLFVYGVGMRTHTGVAERMFGALAARGINIRMINTSEVCVSVVVESAQGEPALAALRECFGLG